MATNLNTIQKILEAFKDKLLQSINVENIGYAKRINETDFTQYTEEGLILNKCRIDHTLKSANVIGSVYNESNQEMFCSVEPITSNTVIIVSDVPIKGNIVLIKNGQ